MLKILGFFNLFFGLLEIIGLGRYIRDNQHSIQSLSIAQISDSIFILYIYPFLLFVIGIINIGVGLINLGAIAPKSKKQEFGRVLIGASLIFASTLVFWDLIIV